MAASLQEIRRQRTIAVIDGNSLMHRAFHAVPDTMTAPDGRTTNACFGFLAMLLKLVDDFKPNGVVCAFDAGRPKFRMDALATYKAQRPPMDPHLKEQFPMMEELLAAMNIPVVREEGWEGDDILGTIAARGEAEGRDILLVTGDKDAFQLASDHVSIVTTKKGISDVVVYDPEAVLERYGVTPTQVPDFLGLKGDPSDNIPGVPGVGPKTAADLLERFETLEGIYEQADSLKGKLGENIRANRQAAFDSRTVATISRDVPLNLSLDEVVFPSFDPEAVKATFGKYRFNLHLAHVLSLANGAVGAPAAGQAGSLSLADAASGTAGAMDGTTEAAGTAGTAGVAGGAHATGTAGASHGMRTAVVPLVEPVLEGDGATHLIDDAISEGHHLGIWIAGGDKTGKAGEEKGFLPPEEDLFVATGQGVAHFPGSEMVAVLARLVKEGDIVCLDSKADLARVYPPDTSEEAFIELADIDPARIFDLSLSAYLLESQRSGYALSDIFEDYALVPFPKAEEGQVQGAVCAACVLALFQPLNDAVAEDGSMRCLTDIEMPLVPVLLGMERTGVDVDPDVLARLSSDTAGQIADLQRNIYRQAGAEFNIDSTKQLAEVLFDKLKLPVQKKTKTRGYSTDAKVLAELTAYSPLPQLVIDYRELTKIKSTYMDALPPLIAPDGRLHTSFNQYITATGRLSSSDPNLQNIPVRSDFGRQIRTAFVPKDEESVFLTADYSQIELRLLAHMSGDPGLIAAFTSGADFHTATAARVFGVPREEVTPAMRSRAKAVNFGIVYGQQAYGLSQSLKIGFKEAQEMIDRYFDAYPRVRQYLDDTVAFAHEHGYVTTLFGRKRRIPELSSHNANLRSFGERTAMNHPMQGTAADVIKLAMIEVGRRLVADGFRARLCLQVHDELDFECPKEETERLGSMVAQVMSGIVKLDVPLEVSVATGRTWADAK